MEAGEGIRFALGRGTQQFSRLAAKLIEVGWEGKLAHDVSIAARGPRPGRERRQSCRTHNLVIAVEVDSVLPANPAAPPGAVAGSLPAAVAGVAAAHPARRPPGLRWACLAGHGGRGARS